MRAFRVQYLFGNPTAQFEGDDEEAWVLNAFLSEARSSSTQMIDAISDARARQDQPVEFGGNEITLRAIGDSVTVLGEWIKDEHDEPCTIQMSADEAELLLLRWKKILDENSTR